MIKNYLTTALRNFRKNKTASAINIFGLTIGLTSCLLIALYIQHELSYDSFELKGNRIARVIMEYRFDGSGQTNAGNYTSVRVASVLKKNFPEVETGVKMANYETVVGYGEKLIAEKRFMYADAGFFSVFTFPLLQGDPNKALAEPQQVVLTESTARRYFGKEDPMGKTLHIGTDSSLYQVTGIMKDCPSNSQIKFDFLASFSSLGLLKEYEETYWSANYTTYLLLKNEGSRAALQARLPAFMKKEMEGKGATINFFLEPFNSIHLHSEYGGFEPNNSIAYIYIMAAVALLILIIACFTYINLSTARSIERAREVGVRKVIGASRKQLFWQFIGESGGFCLVALAFSLALADIMLPYFNQLTEKQLHAGALFSPGFLGFSLLITSFVGILAGSYPALILAGFHPIKVLKGSFKNMGSGQLLRKSLIVFQFAISVFLIISTFIIRKQLNYIQHKQLGYDREQVLVLPMDESFLPRLPRIKKEFKSDPDIISVSRCARSPAEGGGGYNMSTPAMPAKKQFAVTANPIDEDFIKTVGMQIIAGADLSEQDMKDVSPPTGQPQLFHFILNESAARQLGWTPQQAIGQKMFMDATRPGIVKGVVRDFHFESLHKPIKSFVMFSALGARELLIKLSGHNLPQSVAFLEAKWKTLVPERPFEYRFMDEDFNKLYHAELNLSASMNLFAGIAIVLACLGLFGLSSYAAGQRIKEIGIRKVLGASVAQIVAILSLDFVKMALISLLIAFPLAGWMMTKWLRDFSYRTTMGWGIYMEVGCLVLFLALLTVSIRAINAALANPVKSLRSE